ncbi:hypothetical protein ACJO5Y_00370 [Marinobacter sp. GN3S48]|uniref:hypothetical protein n=1 Tax=Marinobacter sp. GN3S48 TaxID=3382302 RepID=UPI00387AC798
MLGELISELRAQAADRIRNPLLGPFTAAWIVSNWKLLTVLIGSNVTVEQRISFIEQNYLHLNNLLIAPLLFAVFYALILPWINFVVQKLQEVANLHRRKHKLGVDTDFLVASVARAEAQANLNRILAKDQLAREQQDEINRLKNELTEMQNLAQTRIAEKEAELEKRKQEYEKRANRNTSEAEVEKQKIESLRDQLQRERDKARYESERVKAELEYKQREIEKSLNNSFAYQLSESNFDFESFLLSKKFRLFYNPSMGRDRSKTIRFGSGGKITEGDNDNENTWRIVNGKLELIQADGHVHSRFFYLPDSQMFIHTGDNDTKSIRGQYIIPDGNWA